MPKHKTFYSGKIYASHSFSVLDSFSISSLFQAILLSLPFPSSYPRYFYSLDLSICILSIHRSSLLDICSLYYSFYYYIAYLLFLRLLCLLNHCISYSCTAFLLFHLLLRSLVPFPLLISSSSSVSFLLLLSLSSSHTRHC